MRPPWTRAATIPKYKTVIFVNGCFWHGHEECRYFVRPKNNAEFWEEKITGNIQRDKHNHQLLANQGWRVIEIWECQLKRSVVDNTLQNLALQIIG